MSTDQNAILQIRRTVVMLIFDCADLCFHQRNIPAGQRHVGVVGVVFYFFRGNSQWLGSHDPPRTQGVHTDRLSSERLGEIEKKKK